MRNSPRGGYALLAAAVACPAIATGMTTLFPLWVLPWTTEFEVPRSTIMLTFALAGILTTLLMPFVGRLLVHMPSGIVIAAGAAAMGLGFIALPWLPSFGSVAVIYALAHALGGVLAGPLPAQSFAIRRLPNAAGKVGGLMMIGLAAGGGLLPLAFAPILAHYGWRGASTAAGLAVLVVVPALALFFLQGSPPCGDKDDVAKDNPADAKLTRITTRKVVTTPAFWLILLAVLPLLGGIRALQTNLVPIVADAGGSAKMAAYILSLMAFASAAGALLVGWLADRADPRLVLTGVSAVFAAGLMALWTQPGLQVAGASMLAIGVASGGAIPLLGAFVVRCFGPEGYAPVAGLMGPFMIPAVFGPVAAGFLRDQTGDYRSFFAIAVLIVGVGVLAVWRLGRKPGRPVSTPPPVFGTEPAHDH